MRFCCVVIAMLALSAVPPSTSAARLAQGKSVIWVGLNGNRAQLMKPAFKRESIYEAGELGLHLAYSYFVSDSWAGVVSGGFDVGSTQLKPASGPTYRESINSWNVRLGFDRYAFINDDVALYAGPGILYWKGMASDTNLLTAGVKTDWPDVDEWAFNGRLGMYARLGGHFGLFGHIGQVIGVNSADESAGKVTWWSSHHEGSVGLAIDF